MKEWVVIAAYNEGVSVSKVVKNLLKNNFKNVVVVDDGSRDDTYEEALNAGATVLRHKVNRGQGAALQTGIEYALDKGADILATFDADGQHQIKDLKKMVKIVKSKECDFILGSRFMKGAAEIPFERRMLLRGSVIMQRIVWRLPLTDAHNGLRVLSREAARHIKITSDRMEHSSQVAEQLVRSGLRYKEVPVDIIYTEETLAKGHGSLTMAFKVLLRYFWRKLIK